MIKDIKNFIESFSEPRVDFYVSSIEVNEKKGFFERLFHVFN